MRKVHDFPQRSKKNAATFLGYLLLTVLGLAATIATFNYLVNPYRLYFPNSPATVTDKKPRPEQLQQEIRTALALRSNADTFVFGNSMMEIGVNPQSEVFVSQGITVFNMGIAGFTLGESTGGFLSVLDRKVPKHAVIAASFADYLMQGPAVKPVTVATKERSFFDLGRLTALSLLGGEATLDSLKTLTINRRAYPQTITAYGHNPMIDYAGHASRSGYRVIFETANLRIHETLRKHQAVSYSAATGPAKAIEELRSLVTLLQSRGSQVTVVINPLHVDYTASLRKFGLMPTYEAWKRDLAVLSGQSNVPVVDFGCEGKLLVESIPLAGDHKTPMQGYWDAQHFKPRIGNAMVDIVLKSNLMEYSQGHLVGKLLKSDSINLHNERCALFFDSVKNTLKAN